MAEALKSDSETILGRAYAGCAYVSDTCARLKNSHTALVAVALLFAPMLNPALARGTDISGVCSAASQPTASIQETAPQVPQAMAQLPVGIRFAPKVT